MSAHWMLWEDTWVSGRWIEVERRDSMLLSALRCDDGVYDVSMIHEVKSNSPILLPIDERRTGFLAW